MSQTFVGATKREYTEATLQLLPSSARVLAGNMVLSSMAIKEFNEGATYKCVVKEKGGMEDGEIQGTGDIGEILPTPTYTHTQNNPKTLKKLREGTDVEVQARHGQLVVAAQ